MMANPNSSLPQSSRFPLFQEMSVPFQTSEMNYVLLESGLAIRIVTTEDIEDTATSPAEERRKNILT
uniref:Ovule protein n=1 Tax=Caenorhabditis tropicalis TaxID=1561998 RepID=A0A1I7TC17_9PELO